MSYPMEIRYGGPHTEKYSMYYAVAVQQNVLFYMSYPCYSNGSLHTDSATDVESTTA